jgi:hypothetical protein
MASETEAKITTEETDRDVVMAVGERPADSISVVVNSAAGPISIVRTTQKGATMMQHC